MFPTDKIAKKNFLLLKGYCLVPSTFYRSFISDFHRHFSESTMNLLLIHIFRLGPSKSANVQLKGYMRTKAWKRVFILDIFLIQERLLTMR